jgi:2-dehydro-3-deoxy-D-arabinonate dehydratase
MVCSKGLPPYITGKTFFIRILINRKSKLQEKSIPCRMPVWYWTDCKFTKIVFLNSFMLLYNTQSGALLAYEFKFYLIDEPWDTLINRDGLEGYLLNKIKTGQPITADEQAQWLKDDALFAPIGSQEVWAAGVTYLKSRDARMEESQSSGAASLYDRVYDAERPELFFKATASRVSGHKQVVYIRKDSAWDVPEPELTLFINSNGNIQGYTCGNDMSSRSIEGENALYLPQAKYTKKAPVWGLVYMLPPNPSAAIQK